MAEQSPSIGSNNPYNIRDYNQNWDGQTGATAGFVDFETLEAGGKAAPIQLPICKGLIYD